MAEPVQLVARVWPDPTRRERGELARLRVDVLDEARELVDADELTVSVKEPGPDFAVATYAHGTDPELVRDEQGRYRFDLALSLTGTWHWRWEAGGDTVGAAEGSVSAAPSAFPAA